MTYKLKTSIGEALRALVEQAYERGDLTIEDRMHIARLAIGQDWDQDNDGQAVLYSGFTINCEEFEAS